MKFVVEVRDLVPPHPWCMVVASDDEQRARRVERALLVAGRKAADVRVLVGTLLRDTSDPSLTWDAAAAERAARAAG